MIDTMTMFLPSCEVMNYSKEDAAVHLAKVRYHSDSNIDWYSGYIGNLYLKAMDRGITIKGSLSGFYFGNNLYSLNRNDTKHAFEKLQDSLKFNLKNGIITSLDVAQNVELNHAPSQYLSLFGSSRRTKPQRWKDTVYYENQSVKKVFYDKGMEMAATGKLPDAMQGKNLLRYELRYKKGFRAKFGIITPEKLLDCSIRKSLINNWEREYKAIKKQNVMTPNYSEITTPGEYEKILMMEGIRALGIDEMLKKIDLTAMDKKSRYRARKRLRELISDSEHSEKSDLIQELDEKIKAAAIMATD